VSDVVLAVRFRGSRMHSRVAAVKVGATSVAIGSGGSAGIEGPVIQIGSAIGSAIGRRMGLSEEGLRITLASGAAAAIAATFHTPLAGVFFALEVILVDFSSRSFSVVVLSAVVANVVSRSLLGDTLVITAPAHVLVHPSELLLYLLLGILAAGVGLAFTLTLDRVDAVFSGWTLPNFLKPAVGGLAVGVIALAFPQVMGLGYGTIDVALGDSLPIAVMAALIVVKMVATALTVGSGSSGGVIGPSLYLGAVLGGTVGTVFHALLPQVTATPGAYALVGMGTVFAATAHAPITAIFTVFELTNDYELILPLMVACVTSAVLAHRVTHHTIYSVGLRRRGIDIQTGRVGLAPIPGVMFLNLEVATGSRAAGRRVGELELPAECLLISVRRQDEVMLPKGDTLLQPGDAIVASCAPGCEHTLREMVEGGE
jgi:chloride channel protein, CIC family